MKLIAGMTGSHIGLPVVSSTINILHFKIIIRITFRINHQLKNKRNSQWKKKERNVKEFIN